MMEIKNRTALITGGASGLGAATARRIAASGGNVVILDVQEENGQSLAAELGPSACFIKCDVTDEEEVQKVVAKAKELFSSIHFCINCAGTGWAERTVSKAGSHQLRTFEMIVRLNLLGTFNVGSKAAFVMSANVPDDNGERGVIVNVASTAAFDGQIGQAAYAASKGGVVGMTLPMARDLSSLGIRVNTIAPGLFKTPLLMSLPPENLKALNESVPFPRRLGIPEEFAVLVAHIITNSYINGETIRLDGALRMAPK
jgi:3-hydroxyacyl-CoA dehydrogenase/3-hydroxy-2-methylbutyryl-CoA dehydrogenase